MKKAIFKTSTALIVSALLLSTTAMAADYTKEFGVAYGSPEIDGVLDDTYAASDAYTLTFPKDGAASYSTAQIYWNWDETALYVYAAITDDTPSTNADTTNINDIWKTDCIEIGFNLTPELEAGDPHNTANSLVSLAAQQYGSEMDIYGTLSNCGETCITAVTDFGWVAEIKYPFFNTSTGLTNEAGNQYSMYAILHNDTTDDNERDSETYFDEVSIGVQYDSNIMDKMVLLEKPQTNVVPEDEDTVVDANTPVTAPATSDAGIVAAAAIMAVAAGVVLSKKR